MKVGTNSAIFILFFGIALIEAFQAKNWLFAAVFVLLAVMCLRADSKTKK